MATESKNILLTKFNFCHVQDQNTGRIVLHEGPKRLQLESHELLIGGWDKIRLSESQFAVVQNPFNAEKGDIVEGEWEIRRGPCVFALHPGESLNKEGIQSEHVLSDQAALFVRADRDIPNPIGDGVIAAGTKLLIRGPRRFVPVKHLTILEARQSLPLSADQGIFVQNDDTGEVRLVKGPTEFFLAANESLWNKELTTEEEQALGLASQSVGRDSRVLSSAARAREESHEAIVIDLVDNEAICLFNGSRTRVEFGPKTIFLEPNERPKVLVLSGGVPVRPNVLLVAKLGLGPDFIRDQLTVRTSDNATLKLEVNFRWRFKIDAEHPERLFALKDFVGFTAQTLSSEIREAAAQNTFEIFHAKAAEIIKEAIFEGTAIRLFDENGLEIIGVDIESISHEDKEIQANLTKAIRTNVEIVTKRAEQEAQLASDLRLIEGRTRNEAAREGLLKREAENSRTKALADAQVKKEAAVLQAQADAEARRVTAESELECARAQAEAARIHIETQREQSKAEAEAIKLKGAAEAEAEKQRVAATVENLKGEEGLRFVQLAQAQALKATDKLIVVPADSKLVFGNLNELTSKFTG